ncbi:keratin, type I cytoskeletal 19-like [Clarias magur]|uniref:Keratin, type I cytoskeletal 19-like n=1 Tax=Clarias magur TaxID=1594786 RepID=A0A8J5C9F2_CLAMG|nr:keratin, type I cytoskeletal 19-like [Clarias magur]
MSVRLHRSASYSNVSRASVSTFGDYATTFDFSSSSSPSYEFAAFGNEKMTMQNLNSRLAAYLEKVLSLQKANLNIEQKIKEYYESRTITERKDLSHYYIIIEDLQKQTRENQEVRTKLHNAQLAASDFRNKFEVERNMHLIIEADVQSVRKQTDRFKDEIEDLKFQFEGLNNELEELKKSHEEELIMVHNQKSGSVDVQLALGQPGHLDEALHEMRERYEALILKNRKLAEQWFNTKVSELNSHVHDVQTDATSSQTSSRELKKKYQSMEIEMNGFYSQIQILQNKLVEVGARSASEASQLNVHIEQLVTELQQIKMQMQKKVMETEVLEQEIAEYRRLLEGELDGFNIKLKSESSSTTSSSTTSSSTTVAKTVTTDVVKEMTMTKEEEEEYHRRQIRVKVIKEELVDGVVVAVNVEEKVQDVST